MTTFRNAIELDQIEKRLGTQRVLDGLSLVVPSGSFTAVVGPSGAGKTTLLKLVVGLLSPDAGAVFVEGRDLALLDDRELAETQRCIGVSLQGSQLYACGLFGGMTVRENLLFALEQTTRIAPPNRAPLSDEWLGRLGISTYADELPENLSAGTRKLAGLARALVLERRLLVLDDVDGGLDPPRVRALLDLLGGIAADGTTILLTTHNPDVANSADVVHLLRNGRIAVPGGTRDFLDGSAATGDLAHPVQTMAEEERELLGASSPGRLLFLTVLFVAAVIATVLLILPQLGSDRLLSPF